MRFRPRPKNTSFFTLLTELATCGINAAHCLQQLIDTADLSERKKLRKEIHQFENQGDDLNHEMTAKLVRTFVTPLERDDLSHLSNTLDDTIDYLDEAGDLIVLYGIETLPKGVWKQVAVLTRCAELTAEAMPKLKDPSSLRDYWQEINKLEDDGDKLYRNMLKNMFDLYDDPKEIIKIKDIVNSLERGIDSFEHLAHVIETLAIKES